MKRCPRCNAALLSSESNYCHICGHKLNDAAFKEEEGFLTKEEGGVVRLIRYLGHEKEVTIPQDIDVICKGSFHGIDCVETIDIGEGVTVMERGSIDCPNLRGIRIRRQLRKYDDPLWNCHRLEGIYYDGSIEDWIALEYIPGARSHAVFLADPKGNRLFGDRRYGGVKEIRIDNEYQGAVPDHKFVGFHDLETVVLPDSVVEIGYMSFVFCRKLKSIVFPKGLGKIGDFAFFCCGFESLVVPSGIQRIGEGVFTSCESLEEVHLPKGLESIHKEAFADCPKLRRVFFEGTKEEWEKIRNRSPEIRKGKVIISSEAASKEETESQER